MFFFAGFAAWGEPLKEGGLNPVSQRDTVTTERITNDSEL